MSTLAALSPVNIGVAGLGRMGNYHLERLCLRSDCRIVAAADLRPEARSTAGAFGCQFHDDWRALLDDPHVELLLIATPPAEHTRMALDALKAGKHVIVETPLCLTSADAELLVSTAHSCGRLLSVADHRRQNDDFRAARTALDEGSLGELRALKLIVWNSAMPATTAAVPAANWQTNADTGGGVLWQFGLHYFEQLLELVPQQPLSLWAIIPGLPLVGPIEWERVSEAARATAASDTLAPSPPLPLSPSSSPRLAPQSDRPANAQPAETAFLAVIRFAGGVVAQIEVDLESPLAFLTGWLLSGTRGGYENFRTATLTDDGEIFESRVNVRRAEIDEYYSAVVRHLREGAPPDGSLPRAAQAIRLVEACRHSARTGQTVHFDARRTSEIV